MKQPEIDQKGTVAVLKKILSFLKSRLFFFGISILTQIAALVLGILYLGKYGLYIYVLFIVMSIATILYIVSKRDNPMYKLAWVIPIALFPLLGWLLYMLAGRESLARKTRGHYADVCCEIETLAPQDEAILQEIGRKDLSIYRQVRYLHNVSELPIYKNTQTEFLSPGEEFFACLCQELEKAQKFIFMEYFIVQEGTMWDTILEILVRKAKAGVKVKFMYDDVGSLLTVPWRYRKKLVSLGIDTHVFNKFRPSVDAFMNYRDHRKITVIDGNVGFTGGNNLADEYINGYPKHGHWKDAHLMLKGDAVWNLSVMFLEMWNFGVGKKLVLDRFEQYRPTETYPTDGYVLPYGDSPLDDKLVGEMCYMNMIENAERYISINTPYLILDNEMTTALSKAALSGVKVQIITPGVADKWYVHMVTRYNYKTLVDAGVEIYEYTPGFIHAKTIVVDDHVGVVGTQNFDFRSFYLHFECGAFLYETSTLADIRRDHLATMARCHRITPEECRNKNGLYRLLQIILNLFAPLM